MKLMLKFAAAAMLALTLVPNAAYADDRRNANCKQPAAVQDNCRADDGERRKPKFQTKFFSE
jgi:hypothetical protein